MNKNVKRQQNKKRQYTKSENPRPAIWQKP